MKSNLLQEFHLFLFLTKSEPPAQQPSQKTNLTNLLRGVFPMTINFYTIYSNRLICLRSLILNLPQPSNSTPNSHSTRRTQTISTTSNSLFTTSTRPNTNNCTLDRVLTAEGTTVCGVLGHFNLAEEFTEGGSVACSVFTGDSDLSCALSHG